jgi:hypothetical protein
MNKLLRKVIPHVRNGEVTIKSTMGDFRGIVNNVVIYSKAGDFFVKFDKLSATPAGLQSHEDELPCWDIIDVVA